MLTLLGAGDNSGVTVFPDTKPIMVIVQYGSSADVDRLSGRGRAFDGRRLDEAVVLGRPHLHERILHSVAARIDPRVFRIGKSCDSRGDKVYMGPSKLPVAVVASSGSWRCDVDEQFDIFYRRVHDGENATGLLMG